MTDDLVFSIFKEIATLEGRRKANGTWEKGATSAEIQRILTQAFRIVHNAATNHLPGERAASGRFD